MSGWRHPEPISLKEVQNILKSGNINQEFIRIPDSYSEFREQWPLEYFYDPLQDHPKGFNPFSEKPATLRYSGPQTNYDPSKIVIEKDVRFKTKEIKKHESHLTKLHKKIHGLKDQRDERYTDDEIYEAKSLLKKGMKGIDIFRSKYPECKSFSPTKDYAVLSNDLIDGKIIRYRDLKQYECWSKYQRTLRLIRRIKERQN